MTPTLFQLAAKKLYVEYTRYLLGRLYSTFLFYLLYHKNLPSFLAQEADAYIYSLSIDERNALVLK